MKQGKLIRRAVSAALAGCMMFTLSAPALAESTDALMQLNISGNRAVSVLDAENVAEEIKINNNVIDPADYENIVVTPGNYTFHYDPVQKILTSTNTTKTINTITIEVPDDVDVVLDGKENIAVHNLTINRAHDVTISSDNYSAIGRRAVITCTGKVTINAPEGTYAIGYTSNADGTLIIHRANEVEIDASGSSRVLSGYGKADITCDGPVTIHGEKDGGSVLANAGNFTYHRTDGADYVYFTSEDGEEGAIDAGVTPIEANARYSYLRIEEKQDAHLKVNNGTATAGDTTSGELDSFKGQKVTVVSKVQETDDRKFDGWELTNAPAGFTISDEKLAQREFSFIMPAGDMELTAHHSNRLEVSGGTATVNGNSVDFARPGAAVTVTAGSPEDYQFDHWEVSGGNIGKTEEELKVSPLSFTMPDAAVKLNAVYKAAVKVSNGTAQTDNTTGETVYALEGASVTVTGHDSNASSSKLVGWKLKKGSLTAIIDADGNSLNVTVDAEDNYLLDASGAKIKNETFTFIMSDKPVELSAVYSIPAIAMSLPVIVEGGTINGTQDSFARVKAGEKVTIKADAPAENMQFHHWKVEEGTSADFGVTVGTLGSDTEQGTEEIAFIMPRGAVRLTAHHSNKLEVSGGTAKVNGNSNADFARPGAAVTVTADSPEDYQFDHWEVSGGNIGKTEEELKVSPLSFTMPDAAVKLNAVYKAAVKVSNGTAQTDNTTGETVYALEGASVTVTGHDSNASSSKLVGWKLKKGSLTAIIDADGNSLNVTVDAEDNYLLDASGAKIKNETFTFIMSDKPVELSAVYSIPAIAMSLPVIVEGGTINGTQDSFARVKAGEKVTIKADAPAENMQFHHWKVEEGTSADFSVTIGTLGSDTEQGTEEIAFIMPRGAVRLTAQWSATPATRPDPDQPLDEDFGVDTPQPKPEPEEPEAPAESAAGAIAAVAIGGAAVWGGYEITTRAILKNLLPADAAIPKTQGQLAELLWQNAGCPQPTVAQATDAAAAARWCVEQGYLEEDFAPEKYVPKYKVIRILKQAKSAT